MKKPYIFVARENFTFFNSIFLNKKFEAPYLRIDDGFITVPKGYAWDGCTPKRIVKDLVIGTPDGSPGVGGYPKTYFASMIHDALYQYKAEVPVSRKETDCLFYSMLADQDFYWAKVYYKAVRMFGGFLGEWRIS